MYHQLLHKLLHLLRGGLPFRLIIPGGGYITLTGPVYAEATSGNVTTGTIVLKAPTGFQFDTSSTPSVLITRVSGGGNSSRNINGATSGNSFAASVTVSTISFTITSASTNGVTCSLTWQGIKVRPTAGSPLASGDITKSGAPMVGITNSVTNFGTLTEIAGAPSVLNISTIASPQTAGTAFGITITGTDQFGNNANGTIAISTSTGGTVSPATATMSSGTATTNITLTQSGTNKTITASYNAVTKTSNTFTVNAGAASKLVFSQQPTNTVAGSTITPSVKVEVRDANDNVVTSDTRNVTLAIGTNPGSGTLSGTTTIAAVAGVATFSNLSINKTGTGYTLNASSSPALTGATSGTFNITPGTATKLVFSQQPSNTVAGSTIAPSVKVEVRDANDNVVTSDTRNITLAIGTNPGSGTLSGTTTIAAVAGVATFSNLSINKTGTGYTLNASSSPALTGATSGTFNITPGTATKLVFSQQPTNTVAGSALSPSIVIEIRDANDNVVTSDTRNVTLAIGTNPGSGTLSGTTTIAAVAGVATFSNLSINKTGTGYTLNASSSPALTTASSSSFNIIPGALNNFLIEASGGGNIGTQSSSVSFTIRITARDALNNTVTTFNGTVDLDSDGTLSTGDGTTSSFTNGVLSSYTVSVATPGTTTITAIETGGSATGTSNSFNVTAGGFISAQSGNWNTPSTWTGGVVPGAGDQVNIQNGHTITVTVNASCSSITFNGANATLTVNNGVLLAVSGSITLNNGSTSRACTISGAGSITAGSMIVGPFTNPGYSSNSAFTTIVTSSISSFTISNNLTVNSYAGSGQRKNNASILIPSGNVTVNGTLVTTSATGTTTSVSLQTGVQTGTLVLGGATPFSHTGAGTVSYLLNGTGSTVQYSRNGSQNIYNTVYQSLMLSGTGTKTLTANATVNGTLSISGGATLDLSNFTLGTPTSVVLECGGTTSSAISGSGVLTIGGNITVNDAGSGSLGAIISAPLNLGNSRTITVADDGTSAVDLTISNTINHSTFSITKEGAGTLSFGSQPVTLNNFVLNAGALVSTSGTMDLKGNLTNNSVFNHNNGTVTFTGTSGQTINGTSPILFSSLNLINSNGLAITGVGTIGINGSLTLTTGVLNVSGQTLTFQNGNIPIVRDGGSQTGTITTSTTTNLVFGATGNTGGSAFTLPSGVFTSIPSINHFTINRTNFIGLGSQDITINGTLTLTSGVLSAGSNNIILGASTSIAGGNSSSYVNGNLKRFVPIGLNPTLSFPVGDGTYYTPASLSLTGNVSSATGSITIRSVSGEHPSIGGSGINNSRSVNRYWTITNNSSIPGLSGYSPTFTYVSTDNDAGTTPSAYVVRSYDGTTWTSLTGSGTPTNTSASASGVTVFGDFAIGQITGTISVSTHPASVTVCEGSNVSFTSASLSTPAPAVKWQRDNGSGYEDITSILDGGIYSGFNTGTLVVTGTNTSINSYTYQAVFTNINGTISSNPAVLTVNPILTPTATLTMNGSNPVCSGSTVLFTTIAGNTGGGTVTYNFKVNGSSVQSGSLNTYSTSALAGGDVVSCDISIAGGACLTSTTASSNTNFSSKTIDVQNPALSISANTGNSICSGTTVIFTANATNVSATSLTYSFKKNGSPVQTGSNNQFSTSSLSDNDVITCEMTLNGGTCSGRIVTSNSVTMAVNPNVTPTVTISATPGSVLCSGTAAVFTASVSNTGGGTVTSYNFKVNGTSVQNSASNSFTINSPVNGSQVTCDVNVSGGVCSAATASSNTVTLSVAAAPTVTINSSVPGSVCAGTNVTYTASTSNVSGATVTYNFRVNGVSQQNSASAGFVYAPANNDVVDCIISLAGGTCSGSTATSNNITANVVSSLTPTVSISVTPGTNISSGATVTFTATTGNTGGGTITYLFKVNGTIAQSGASSTFAVSTLANGDQVTCDINIAGGTCLGTTSATSNTITISVTSFVWIGAANTNWNNTSNWSGGAIPTNGASILIQTGAQHHPVINNGTITANNITLQSGTSLTVGGIGVLQVAGTISNAGLLSMTAGTIEFNGSSTQTVDGNLFLGATVKNIRISNNVTLTGTLNVTGIVSFGNVNNKTLASAGYLVLKSSSSATAIVTDLTNSNTNTGNTITGNVVVERYIPASRKWRAISAPLKGNTNNSIFANWQNNGLEEEGTGVSLWSPGGSGAAGNGFSLNSANGSSANIRGYGNGAFTIPTSTKSSLLFDNGGPVPYLVFVTDQYTNANNTSKMYNGATATTLKATGNLITGTYTINSLGAGFRMIANPYASPVDFATIGKTNINNQFWIWDPKLSGGSGYGGYVYTSNSGGGYVSAPLGGSYTSNSTIIQPGSAFWVKVNDGFVGSLTFNETDKKTTGTFNIYGRVNGGMNEILRVNLTSGTEEEVLDGVAAAYHQNSSVNLESSDAVKFSIGNENISIRRFSKDLAIEFRPLIETRDTVFIRLNNMQQKQYNLVISGENFNVSSNLTAVLQDLYLNNETPINIYGQQVIPFSVTAVAASTGDRFRIVFRPSAVTPVTDIQNQKGFRIYPNPVVKGMEVQFELRNMVAGKYQVTITDIKGARITSYFIQHRGGNATHSMKLPSVITAGTYIAEIKNQKGETEQVKLTVQ